MRIGVMLRHYDQHGGGVKVYTHNLLQEMLALDSPHEFVLIYNNPIYVGTYSDRGRVREVAVKSPSIFFWDQLAVRKVEKEEDLDLIFNPKYSVPMLAECKTVFVCHGLDWYVEPKWSKWTDRVNHRFLIPRYARKADGIIAVSETARQHLCEYLEVRQDRVYTIYNGVDDIFRRRVPAEKLNQVKRTYHLPRKFFLYVGQIYPPKNFGRLIRAYSQVGPQREIYLVVAGEHRCLCSEDLALIKNLGLSGWIIMPGWIENETLPVFYRLASALLLPSLYEACPIPILEAMAAGCPVITSNRYGTKEMAGEAGLLINPEDIEDIASGMLKIIHDRNLRERLISEGLKRVRSFTWKRCAQETMGVLEALEVRS